MSDIAELNEREGYIHILNVLRRGPATRQEIASRLETPISTISARVHELIYVHKVVEVVGWREGKNNKKVGVLSLVVESPHHINNF